MISKTTALKLALFSATLGILFAYWRLYVCAGAAFLLLLIFNGIWAAKVNRDRKLSKWRYPVLTTPAVKTSKQSYRLVAPSSFE
jgi:hypothetical protein